MTPRRIKRVRVQLEICVISRGRSTAWREELQGQYYRKWGTSRGGQAAYYNTIIYLDSFIRKRTTIWLSPVHVGPVVVVLVHICNGLWEDKMCCVEKNCPLLSFYCVKVKCFKGSVSDLI